MYQIMALAASIISIYAIICCVRIVLTWFPRASYHPVTQFLAKICDPFLDMFRGLKFLRIGHIDFSPAIALCILGVASSILSGIAQSGTLRISIILAMIVSYVWQIAASIIMFIIIILAIRLIYMLVTKSDSYTGNPLMNALDQTISAIAQNVSKSVTHDSFAPYKKQIIITIIALVAVYIIGGIVIGVIANIIGSLPL